MIEGKVVKLGNSAAIAIKKKDLERNNLKFNQKIKISVVKNNKQKILEEMFGSARHTRPFAREEKDREF